MSEDLLRIDGGNEIRPVPNDLFEQQARIWDLRYGGLNEDRKKWRIIAFICSVIAIVTTTVMLSTITSSKYIPYVVNIDDLGKATPIQPAEFTQNINSKAVSSVLRNFIYCFRTVSVDKQTLKTNIDQLYAYLNTTDPAYAKITIHFREKVNDPYHRAAEVVTAIQVKSILQMPSGEWIVKWREDVFTRKGKPISEESADWQAIFSVIVAPATIENDKDMNLLNPFGVYVRDINFQKEM